MLKYIFVVAEHFVTVHAIAPISSKLVVKNV